MIYVQHLLGVGHLQRALQLAAALQRQGFRVELVSGGKPLQQASPAGISIHQLTPIHSPDANFNRLLDASGNEVGAACQDLRRRQLLELFDRLSPEALITETFPFGRRMMRFELIPLLQKAHSDKTCIQIISSIRDILQPKSKPGRNQEICNLVDAYYDHVLVHGDPSIASLEASFGEAANIRSKIYYSGYICHRPATGRNRDKANGEVLVSAGGSDTGLRVLETAIAARSLTRLRSVNWRILASPAINKTTFRNLQQQAGKGVVVERNREDFFGLMQQASLSISQAGYNTVTDILASGTPAVVIPFAEAGEKEQSLRAQRLQERGRLIMLEANQLSAAKLAAAVDHALALDISLEVNLDGAANSATQIAAWLQAAKA